MTMLATLIPDANGICDINTQGTYCGGTIPRNRQGYLIIFELLDDASFVGSRLDAYELVSIRMTGAMS